MERRRTRVPERLRTRVFDGGSVSAAAGFARPQGQAWLPPILDYQDRY
jgi:hypothetical protein